MRAALTKVCAAVVSLARPTLKWLGRLALSGWIFVALFLIAGVGFARLIQPPQPLDNSRIAVDLLILSVIFGTSLWNVVARHSEFLVSPQFGKIFASIVGSIGVFAAAFKDTGVRTGVELSHSAWDALCLSLATWTTLSFGDLAPVPEARIIAITEAWLGYFYLALLIAVLMLHLQRYASPQK
jgi:hypothetical protein